ncbi:MAG: DUF5034 domain-containing protein [Bacteroidota bacterium]
MPKRQLKTFLLLSLLLCFGCQPCNKCGDFGDVYRFRFIPPWSLAVLDNSGPDPVEDPDSTVLRTAFGMRISCPAAIVDTVQEDVEADCINWEADTAVISLKIITLMDIDSSYVAGTEVSPLFKLRQSEYSNTTLATHVFYANLNAFYLNQYKPVAYTDLLMVFPPEKSGIYQFDVILTRSDLSETHLRSPKITLQ